MSKSPHFVMKIKVNCWTFQVINKTIDYYEKREQKWSHEHISPRGEIVVIGSDLKIFIQYHCWVDIASRKLTRKYILNETFSNSFLENVKHFQILFSRKSKTTFSTPRLGSVAIEALCCSWKRVVRKVMFCWIILSANF